MPKKDKPVRRVRVIPTAKAKKRLAGDTPLLPGQGYATLTGEARNSAVTGTIENGGARTLVEYKVCTTLEKLAQSLEINQSLSVGFAKFGLDTKVQFVKKLDVTTHGVSIVVFARHVMGTETLVDPVLGEDIEPPKTDKATREFVRVHGDAYVSSVSKGGEYYAVYTMRSQTVEEQTQLVTDLKAKGIVGGGTLTAGLQTALNDFVSKTTTEVVFSQALSGVHGIELPNEDNLVDFARKFPKLTLNAPVVIGYTSNGYERVPKFGAFEKVVKNREYFTGRGIDGGLTDDLVRVYQLKAQIELLDGVYEKYGDFEDEKLEEVRALAKGDIEAIDEQMSGFDKDPVQSFTRPKLPSLDKGLPVLEYTLAKSPLFGGGGGDPFEDVKMATAIQDKTRIVEIKMRSGARVDQLTVTYADAHSTFERVHGRAGGKDIHTLTIGDGAFINAVTGRAGTRIDRLKLTTTKKQSIEGGRDGGKEFNWAPNAKENQIVFALSGRAGKEIDAIQFHTVQLKAARWTKPK